MELKIFAAAIATNMAAMSAAIGSGSATAPPALLQGSSQFAPMSRQPKRSTPLNLTTIEKWLDDSGADDLAKWSHAYLAHAGGPDARKRIADLTVTANKINDAIKALARVTEAISAWLLFAGGRSNALMPVAQFNQFEKLGQAHHAGGWGSGRR